MKALHCDDLMKGCDFVARGDTEDEVMQKAAAHAKNDHGMQSISPEMVQKVKAAIRDEQTT
jgi:predicted small metal-binding protein